MTRTRYTPKSFYDVPSVPFATAEEAWFWYIRCQRVRWEGARFLEGFGDMKRPCDPDDLYRAVMQLYRQRRIDHHHLHVLAAFGACERPPDSRVRDEEPAARLWDQAFDRLTPVLRGKGIVDDHARP